MSPLPEVTRPGARIGLAVLDHAEPELFAELLEAVERVASSGAFTGGEEVEAFEAEFAFYCGGGQAIGCSSGTEALALALRALEIGPGDEVIVPANSFIATAEAVTLVGATPRPIDVDPVTRTMTAAAAAAAIGERTRCVIPVHIHGRTVDMEPLMELARAHGLVVVEDACQAHGALYRGRRVGSIGDAGCFSFYPAKNLGAWGDGGAVVTSDPVVADRVMLLRSHGERPRYHHLMPGTTARLDSIHAAVLRIKLRRLDSWNGRRREVAARLSELLADGPVGLPSSMPGGHDDVFHHFVVTTEERDALRAHLDDRGIASGVHYPIPIHRTDAYAGLGLGEGSLPVAERLARVSCSLPIGPLHSDAEVERIAAAVLEVGTL